MHGSWYSIAALIELLRVNVSRQYVAPSRLHSTIAHADVGNKHTHTNQRNSHMT